MRRRIHDHIFAWKRLGARRSMGQHRPVMAGEPFEGMAFGSQALNAFLPRPREKKFASTYKAVETERFRPLLARAYISHSVVGAFESPKDC